MQIKKYSSSSLKLYKQCRRKFYYNYIKKLKRREWEHNVLGSVVHTALEFFHKNYKNGESLPDLMGKSFKAAREKHRSEIKDKNILKEAKILLQKYLSKMEKEGMPSKVLGIEKNFIFTMGDFKFNGIIDRFDKIGDEYFVWDYKTSKSMKYMDDFQLSLYALWFFSEYKDIDNLNAGYIMLRHNSSVLKYVFTREGLEERKKEILETCKKIIEEETWSKSPGPLCNWCDFYVDFGGPCSGSKNVKEWTVEI